jgi:hypothetical protein
MINDFHFSHTFLTCDSLNVSIVSHSIIETWQNYGCLISPEGEIESYKEWLDYIDPKLSAQWKTAFTYFLQKNMLKEYKPVSGFADAQGCMDYLKTLMIPTIVINQLELNKLELNNGRHTVNEFVEIVNINNLNESQYFEKSRTLSHQGIPEGDDINVVWNERFAPIARNTKKITIIDRYLFENFERDLPNKKPAIEKFIELLSQCDGTFAITIYSVGGSKFSDIYNTITTYIDRTLSKKAFYKKSISVLEINSCDEEIFKRKAHDRYIQFDAFTIRLGSGISIFRDYPISACSFDFYRYTHENLFNSALSSMSGNRLWRYNA